MRKLQQQGLPETMINTMAKARRDTSVSLYNCYIGKWCEFCKSKNYDFVNATVAQGLEFLQSLLDDGSVSRGKSPLNTAKSALSAILVLPNGEKFGENSHVKTFMKGISNLRPARPRYLTTWDPDCILDVLGSNKWNPAAELDLLELSMKLVTMILLATYQRGQLILALNLDRCVILDEEIRFRILAEDVKQGSRANYVPEPVIFRKFDKPELCIVSHLQTYLHETKDIRGDVKSVFITSRKPYKVVSRDTVSRWVKTVMCHAGVNVELFAPGSTRGASSSKAFAAGVPIEEIMKKAGWLRESTFQKWYHRK